MTEPATEPSPPNERGRVVDGLRAVIRQVAGAVYVLVAFALFVRFVGGSPMAMLVLMLALTFVVSVVVSRVVEGRLWTSTLVGVFVAIFVVAVPAVQGAWHGRLFAFVVIESLQALAVFGAGLVGALVGRRWRRRAR